MLHGSGPGVSGWGNFRDNLPALGAHFRCLVLEFPGYGISDPTGEPPAIASAGSVPRFLDGLGLDRVLLLGNSMGGGVATRFAMANPERVAKLVTIGGIGVNILNPFPSEGIVLLSEFADDPTREKLRRWLDSMVFDPALITDELFEERWQLATSHDALRSMRESYGREAMRRRMAPSADEVPYWARFGAVAAPTLIAWGRDDRVSPLDMAMVAMRHIPRAELHVFPRCGHWVMQEQRVAFEEQVVAFLRRPDQPGDR
ncbi:alpha/beta fold hydrolase [Acrocarpospora pleiomorpha]|nr:alpha/beta fold hydrolase [Acrocarpospora pleiomorpha]